MTGSPGALPGAWIAVMRGCDNFCSFCVVPYTRGRERSRDPEGIVQEAQRIAEQGFKQITLLGQNVNSYRFGDWDFARLLTAVADVPGIQRVRFTSPHPKDFSDDVLQVCSVEEGQEGCGVWSVDLEHSLHLAWYGINEPRTGDDLRRQLFWNGYSTIK